MASPFSQLHFLMRLTFLQCALSTSIENQLIADEWGYFGVLSSLSLVCVPLCANATLFNHSAFQVR